jgi:hypothetical protein
LLSFLLSFIYFFIYSFLFPNFSLRQFHLK